MCSLKYALGRLLKLRILVYPLYSLLLLFNSHPLFRVMEWLRAVDLAEYAPNLRGAGVHGGLMVYETKFTADLLASLLSIPPGKTLLRRHLNTHFKELLGRDIIQEKREAQSTMGYIPLTPTAKLKVMVIFSFCTDIIYL